MYHQGAPWRLGRRTQRDVRRRPPARRRDGRWRGGLRPFKRLRQPHSRGLRRQPCTASGTARLHARQGPPSHRRQVRRGPIQRPIQCSWPRRDGSRPFKRWPCPRAGCRWRWGRSGAGQGQGQGRREFSREGPRLGGVSDGDEHGRSLRYRRGSLRHPHVVTRSSCVVTLQLHRPHCMRICTCTCACVACLWSARGLLAKVSGPGNRKRVSGRAMVDRARV